MRTSVLHQQLGSLFFDEVQAARFPSHTVRFRNQVAADTVGLGEWGAEQWVDHLAKFKPLPGSFERPLALRYHGHQFGHYNPALGDGRGFLYAQLYDHTGRLLDLGTKGSGVTPWSRGGDGRLTLQGAVREVLAAERLQALGVPTSRALSVVETGEALVRGDEPSPTRSAVLVRLSHSHVRIGTFQRLAYYREAAAIERLVDHCIRHYLPEVDSGAGAPEMLRAVAVRLAELTAGWMVAGFVHGVLNTDNLNITGESFDYGPWRFLPTLDGAFVAAYFDHGGRYAFARQPEAVYWALQHLAGCLVQVAPQDDLVDALRAFGPAYDAAYIRRMLARMGMRRLGDERDSHGVDRVVDLLQRQGCDYDLFFQWFRARDRGWDAPPLDFEHEAKLDEVFSAHQRIELEPPEAPFEDLQDRHYRPIWSAIAENDDWSLFEARVAAQRRLGAHLAPCNRAAMVQAAPNATEAVQGAQGSFVTEQEKP